MAENKGLDSSSDYKLIGLLFSIFIHLILIIAILFLPHFIKEEQPEAYEGVLVSFGLPIESEGEESSSILPEPVEELEESEEEDLIDKPIQEEIKSMLNEEESEIILEKSEKIVPKQQKRNPSETVSSESKEERMDIAKDEFGKLFNTKGSGQQKAGNQGDPLGEPNAELLEGISRGKGKIGGGLDERGILYEPDIVEDSQKSGRVVVKVCVDKNGKVLSSKFTQKGSTTTDKELVEVAEISGRQYRFMPSEYEQQCGTISINFIVR